MQLTNVSSLSLGCICLVYGDHSKVISAAWKGYERQLGKPRHACQRANSTVRGSVCLNLVLLKDANILQVTSKIGRLPVRDFKFPLPVGLMLQTLFKRELWEAVMKVPPPVEEKKTGGMTWATCVLDS